MVIKCHPIGPDQTYVVAWRKLARSAVQAGPDLREIMLGPEWNLIPYCIIIDSLRNADLLCARFFRVVRQLAIAYDSLRCDPLWSLATRERTHTCAIFGVAAEHLQLAYIFYFSRAFLFHC